MMPLCYPAPELAIPESRPARWRILPQPMHGSASCNPLETILAVPLGDSAVEANVRAHEQIHGRISRRRLSPRIALDCQQAVEDYRVHLWGRLHAGLTWSEGLIDPCRLRDDLATLFPVTPPGAVVDVGTAAALRRRLALACISSWGTGSFQALTDIVSAIVAAQPAYAHLWTEATRIADFAIAGLQQSRSSAKRRRPERPTALAVPTPLRARAVAKWLDRVLGEAPEVDPDLLDRPDSATGDTLPDPSDTLSTSASRHSKKPARAPAPLGAPWLPWGRLTIHQPPRPVPAVPPPLRGGWASRDTGLRIRRPDRLVTDGRIFARKRKHQGGAVLIDASGSMNLSVAALEAIAAAAPAATVAIYAGAHDGTGQLTVVVARKQRVTTAVLKQASCEQLNVVDGPALAWLARQRGPRVWISDGAVTVPAKYGGEQLAPWGNRLEVSNILRRARIRHIARPEGIPRALRGQPPQGAPPAHSFT